MVTAITHRALKSGVNKTSDFLKKSLTNKVFYVIIKTEKRKGSYQNDREKNKRRNADRSNQNVRT